MRTSRYLSLAKLLPALSLLPAVSSSITTARTGSFTETFAVSHTQAESLPIATTYDSMKDRTTVRLKPVQISAAKDKYISVQMSPSFSFSGRIPLLSRPSIIDFELQTVVKGRLRTDLYVVFKVDGEEIFLSSNREAIKRPVPGRVWVGERLVFRMPYETFVKITNAATVEIKFDAVTFALGEEQKHALRDFLTYMTPR